MKKFLVIDGNSIINRAFFGIRPLSNRAGMPTNALYGFMTIIRKHLDSIRPDYLAIAFDVHQPTFRHKEYADYKAGRRPMPDELRVQMPYAKKIATALGFLVIESPGYEADDVIGTTAAMADRRGDIESYILTGDRDSLQLISDRTSVVLAKNKEDVLFDRVRFKEEYGVDPEQFVDVKALMGDSSDNIPGVRGIGEKTAFALIKTAGSLDTLYETEGYFGQTKSVTAKLDEGKDSAYKSKWLATICREAPVPSEKEIFDERPIDGAELAAICRELDFVGMAARFGVNEAHEFASAKKEQGSELTTKEVSEIKTLKFGAPVAFFCDENTVAVTEDGKNIFTCAIDYDDAKAFLKNNTVVCHDYKSLLRRFGLTGDDVKCAYDTKLAAYLLEPGKKYDLKDVSFLYLGREPSTAAETAAAISELYGKTNEKLKEYGMEKLLHEIEIPLSAVLAGMEARGFKIDPDGIREYARKLKMEEEAISDAIWLAAGHQFNINSPKQLGEVLFDEIGLPAGKKTKNGYSTDADTLEELKPYPLSYKLQQIR